VNGNILLGLYTYAETMAESSSSSAFSAATRVQAIPELLGLILAHADQRTLLTSAQRVCRTWHQHIHGTRSLRRHLFLDVPSAAIDGDDGDNGDDDATLGRQKALNPLLAELFPAWFDGEAREPVDVERFRRDAIISGLKSVSLRGRRNARPAPPSKQQAEAPAAMGSLYDQLSATALYRAGRAAPRSGPRSNPFLRSDASWLRMHVSSPPTRSVAVYRVAPTRLGGLERDSFGEVAFPEGLRMGELLAMTLACSQEGYMHHSFHALWPATSGTAKGDDDYDDGDDAHRIRSSCSITGLGLPINPDSRPEFDEDRGVVADLVLLSASFDRNKQGNLSGAQILRHSGADFVSEQAAGDVARIQSIPWQWRTTVRGPRLLKQSFPLHLDGHGH
jgi:hypothetical protein